MRRQKGVGWHVTRLVYNKDKTDVCKYSWWNLICLSLSSGGEGRAPVVWGTHWVGLTCFVQDADWVSG